jgi:hypothetical protein
VLRHPVALRVFFGHLLEPDDLRAAIESHRDWCNQMLDELGAIHADIADQDRYRNATLVAEWGLAYFRGERSAATTVAKAVGACPVPLDDESVPPEAPGLAG